MKNKCKFISGLVPTKTYVACRSYFSEEKKHQIIQDYLNSSCTKQEIWERYTGKKEEHGALLRWMREYGYLNKKSNFASNTSQMKRKDKFEESSESFENLQLMKRVEELEKQLKDAEMKAIAFSTMIDLAEMEFKIPIRKKFNTKPSKK
jgi:transposase